MTSVDPIKLGSLTITMEYVGPDPIAGDGEERLSKVRSAVWQAFGGTSELPEEVGECEVTNRKSGKKWVAKVFYSVESKTRIHYYTLRLVQGNWLGEMRIRYFERSEWGYAMRSTLKGDYESAVEIAKLNGGRRRGAFRGAGSVLVQVAAELALRDNYGLYVDGTGDSWGFWRRVHMTTGDKEKDADVDETASRAQEGTDWGCRDFILDKEGRAHYKALIEKFPILKQS